MPILPQRDPTVKLRWHDYCVIQKHDGSLVLEDMDAEQLEIAPGDGFMAWGDPESKEVTLKRIDLTAVETIET